MTTTGTLVSQAEYLSTSYRPDSEYIEGAILERNVGKKGHSKAQGALTTILTNRRKELGIHVFPEQRIQVSPSRFRIPDVCVVAGAEPDEEVFTAPPFLCIEILSEDDRMTEMQERIDDYLAFGVHYVWLVDPIRRRAWMYTSEGGRDAKDGVLRTQDPEIAVPLSEIFSEL